MAEKMERPKGYKTRIVDSQIEHALQIFGAVHITGTKWCGKTWTSLMHANSVRYIDNYRDLAASDPSLMLIGKQPHLIDEWQLEPRIWDAVRREVDKERHTRGAFILTGSSTPLSKEERPSHSGVGRIENISMRPMTLYESGDSTGEVSLSNLFNSQFTPTFVQKNTRHLVALACRGGWPEAIDMPVENAQFLARQYIDLTFTQSIKSLGLDEDIARRITSSLVRNIAQATTLKTIIEDMFADEEKPERLISENTVRSYLSVLTSIFLVDEVYGWVPPKRSRKRFATKAKRYLADPSLACAMLGYNVDSLLDDWQAFGLIFENLAIRDLQVYAQNLELSTATPVRYYRDDSDLEIDAIIELADGRWAAIEIKASEDKVPKAIERLHRLKRKLCSNPKARTQPPEFLAVITGNGEYARLQDDVYVIPITCLGP